MVMKMAKLTYKQLIDICNARRTDHFWLVNTSNDIKISLRYDDCNHCMNLTLGGTVCVGFDKCRLSELNEGIVSLYRKDVFIGCIDIRDLEAWE